METQKFKGTTLPAALAEIHRLWGPNAVILHVEKLSTKGTLFNPRKQWVEITARPPEPSSPETSPSGHPATITNAAALPDLPLDTPPSPVDLIHEELTSLNQEIQEFSTSVRQMERINWARLQVERKASRPHALVSYLIDNGFSSENAEALHAEWSLTPGSPTAELYAQKLNQQLDVLEWDELFPTTEGRCTLLMGMPGIGKTLLLMKMAARLKLSKQKVILVSADMTRPGPSQEVSMYSEILQIPVRQIFDYSELETITRQAEPGTHILVDGHGISPYESESWQSLKSLRMYHPRMQILLAVSLTSDFKCWEKFRSRFLDLRIKGMVLTQADLEHRLGRIWEASQTTRLPLALISMGKNVPGDLLTGKSCRLGSPLMRGYSLVWAPPASKEANARVA